MKGKITIEVFRSGVYSLDLAISDVSRFDKFMTIDALAESLDLTEEDRLELGALIAIGGLKVLRKDAMTKAEVSDEFIKLIRKRKGNTP